MKASPGSQPSKPLDLRSAISEYLRWASDYYRSPITRTPTGEAENMGYALRPLLELIPDHSPANLQAEDLCACQQWFIDRGLCRKNVNARLNRIRRFLRWCAQPPRRWMPPAVLAEASIIPPLKKGRTIAAEREEVHPVDWETVSSTMAHCDLELATMIELQWWTGMRPGELCKMTRSALKRIGDLLIYEPLEHKTAHHGKKRQITIGPSGMSVLAPWLKRIPAQQDRVWRFVVSTYRQTIKRINRRHKIKPWNPNQIRHSYGTRMAGLAGIEAARISMGHAHVRTTEIYAERDALSILDIIRKFC